MCYTPYQEYINLPLLLLCTLHHIIQGSPGNLQQFEDILFTGNDVATATGVLAIRLANENGQRMVGVAYIDTMLRKMGVCQFVDNEQLSNVEVRNYVVFMYFIT